MGFSVGQFTGNLVGIVVGVVLLTSLLTIIAGVTVPETMENADAIESLIGVLPILATVGVVLSAIYLFISRK